MSDKENKVLDNTDVSAEERMYDVVGFAAILLFSSRRKFYLPLSNTYVIFSMISSFVIFGIIGISFLTTYQSPVNDAIYAIKSRVMNVYSIIMLVLLICMLLSNYFSKNQNILIKRLSIIFLVSIVTMIAFLGIKLNLDSTYNIIKFGQIYNQEYNTESSNENMKIDISLTGIGLKSEREYYIDKSIEAYNVFGVRFYCLVGINILFVIVLIYQMIKISHIQERIDRLNRDDAILFDEEKNIKI